MRSYQASSPITVVGTRHQPQEESWKNYKYVETEQLAIEQLWSQWKKIKGEIKNYSKTNENATQDLWGERKPVLREKFIEQAYLNKQEKSQINNLNITKETRERRTNEVKSQEKEESNKDQRRNKTEPIEKINETNICFF